MLVPTALHLKWSSSPHPCTYSLLGTNPKVLVATDATVRLKYKRLMFSAPVWDTGPSKRCKDTERFQKGTRKSSGLSTFFFFFHLWAAFLSRSSTQPFLSLAAAYPSLQQLGVRRTTKQVSHVWSVIHSTRGSVRWASSSLCRRRGCIPFITPADFCDLIGGRKET